MLFTWGIGVFADPGQGPLPDNTNRIQPFVVDRDTDSAVTVRYRNEMGALFGV